MEILIKHDYIYNVVNMITITITIVIINDGRTYGTDGKKERQTDTQSVYFYPPA